MQAVVGLLCLLVMVLVFKITLLQDELRSIKCNRHTCDTCLIDKLYKLEPAEQEKKEK